MRLTGPRATRAATERDLERWDRESRFPKLRAAAKEMHSRSLTAADDAILRDAARVLNALDLALTIGSGLALERLSKAVTEIQKAEPDRAWGMSLSSIDLRRLPPRKGKGEDGPRLVVAMIGEATRMLRLQWPAETIGAVLGSMAANSFPRLSMTSARQRDIADAARPLLKTVAAAPARAGSNGEKLVFGALVTCGMSRAEAHDRLKGTPK